MNTASISEISFPFYLEYTDDACYIYKIIVIVTGEKKGEEDNL